MLLYAYWLLKFTYNLLAYFQIACALIFFAHVLYCHCFLCACLLHIPHVRRCHLALREHFQDFVLLVVLWSGDYFRGCCLLCLWMCDVHFTTPWQCEYWSMLAYVLATISRDSTFVSIFCFAMLGFVFPAFPPKGRKMLRHFKYLGEDKRLQENNTEPAVSRADAALEFLRRVPEVVQQRWTMEQFDRVWAELKVYVRDGPPSGQPPVPISRDYKGTQLCRKGTSQIPKFFWEVALQRFNAISAIKEETVTVECAKAAFDRLAGYSDPKKLVALAIDLSCILPGSCCLKKDVSDLINGKCWDCFVRSPVAPEDERYECQVSKLPVAVQVHTWIYI